MDNNLMFVQVRSPNLLRKEILKTALDSTSLMKRFNTIKEHKEERKEIINELREELAKIKKLTNSLENKFPKLVEEPKKKVKTKKFVSKKPIIEKEETSEDETLKQEIMDIEKKLRSL